MTIPKKTQPSLFMKIPAEQGFLRLAPIFVGQGTMGLGLDEEAADEISLAAEEVMAYLVRVGSPGGEVEIRCSAGSHYVQADFSFPFENIGLHAFNMTASVSLDDASGMDEMELPEGYLEPLGAISLLGPDGVRQKITVNFREMHEDMGAEKLGTDHDYIIALSAISGNSIHMPRRPRITTPETPLHIIQRGNNRQACFFADEDYGFYLDWLQEYSRSSGCAIHAYVLMTNHVHLLLTPRHKDSAGNLMKRLGQRYVQYINRSYKRSGTLWEGRFRSSVIQQDTYLFTCQLYIEMNPVRAEMVNHPGDYKWSSYRFNGQGESSKLITPHPLYHALGHDDPERLSAYRELFRHELEPGEIDKIRKATNGNFALGTIRFQEEIGRMLGRRVTPGQAGRPRKARDE